MNKLILIFFLLYPFFVRSQVKVYTQDRLEHLELKATCESFKITFDDKRFELKIQKICKQDTLFRIIGVNIFQIESRKSNKFAQLNVFENDIAISSIYVYKESATINYENRRSEVIKGKNFYQNMID